MPVLPDDTYALPPDTVAYYADYEDKRSRLTTFFRFITVIPHLLWLAIWGIGAFFATIGAWFAIVFTAKFPQGIYDFLVKFYRYYARVQSYFALITDKFPAFNGNPDETYEAHLLIGPPLEKYSRWKTFFRTILFIPFYIVAYILMIILELAMVVAWFVIVITGKQPRGLQDALVFCQSYVIRANIWHGLLTEDWPTNFSDESNVQSIAAKGYTGPAPLPSNDVPLVEEAAVAPVSSDPPPPPAPPTV